MGRSCHVIPQAPLLISDTHYTSSHLLWWCISHIRIKMLKCIIQVLPKNILDLGHLSVSC